MHINIIHNLNTVSNTTNNLKDISIPSNTEIHNTEVITFGCRLNIYESEIIKQNIKAANLSNVIVFNTCSVTQEAERQAKQQIRKAKKDNPNVQIIVTGCAAQNDPEMFAKMTEVDKVIGNEEKLHSHNYKIDDNKVVVNDIMSVKDTANHLITAFDGKTRAFIQIQNGCDHRCTFCIIPLGRGNNRSVAIGSIVEQVRVLLNAGYQEIVLTGVDVTAYGSDLPGKPTLAQMIRRLLALVPNLKRLRLSSIDVAEIDSDLFNLMAHEQRIMPHFHISLQSGDNMILKRMKRRHKRQEVIDFCKEIRAKRTNVAFGADIIAGFPTETDEMFLNTANLIEEANLQYLHVFPYSPRPKTPAARMPQVQNDVKKNRAKILRQIGENNLNQFMHLHNNKNVDILIESNNKGHTDNFIPVHFQSDVIEGTLQNRTISYFNNKYMIA